jgi:hypothetical protein
MPPSLAMRSAIVTRRCKLSLPDSFAEGGGGGVEGGTDETGSVPLPLMGDDEGGNCGMPGDFDGAWNRGSMGSEVASVERTVSPNRGVAHHQCPHLVLRSLEGGVKVLVSSTVVIRALKLQELSVLRTEPSHVSLHDWTVSLCSYETRRFCAHQVLEVGWWACELVHGDVEL